MQSTDDKRREASEKTPEAHPFILRSKEELEQEADFLTLTPCTVFSPTAPTVTETTFSTSPSDYLALTAPGIGLSLPRLPPPPALPRPQPDLKPDTLTSRHPRTRPQ